MFAIYGMTIALLATAGGVKADPYGDGVCAGIALAVQASQDNRAHWRALMGAPVKSHAAVLDEIYATPGAGPLAPPPGPVQDGPSLIDSVDLYVVLRHSLATAGQRFGLPDGSRVECPGGHRTMPDE